MMVYIYFSGRRLCGGYLSTPRVFLILMVIDIYFISVMSSEPERMFSGAELTISEQRASLKTTIIELLKCLKS